MEDKQTIKVTYQDKEITLTISWDADIYEWMNAFRIILGWATFSPDQFDEFLPEELQSKWFRNEIS